METMSILVTTWAILTVVLVVLLIYRNALSMHEDDQLFLDEAESHLEREQKELAVRIDRLRSFVNVLGASSGLLVLMMAGPDQRTLPREMFSGIRENINPTITAVATVLILTSVVLLSCLEWLRRRNERLTTGKVT